MLLDQTAAIVADDSFEIQEDGEIVFPLNRVLDDRAQEETDNVSAPDPNIDDVDLGLDLGDFSVGDQACKPLLCHFVANLIRSSLQINKMMDTTLFIMLKTTQ